MASETEYQTNKANNSVDIDGDLSCLPFRQERHAQIFRSVDPGGGAPLNLVAQRTSNIALNAGRKEKAPDRGLNFEQLAFEATQQKGGRFGETHDSFILAMAIQPLSFSRMVTPSVADGAVAMLVNDDLIQDDYCNQMVTGSNLARAVGSVLGDAWQAVCRGFSLEVTPPGSECVTEYGTPDAYPSDVKADSESVNNGFPMLGTISWLRNPIFTLRRSNIEDTTKITHKFNRVAKLRDTLQLVTAAGLDYALIYQVKYIIAMVNDDGSPLTARDAAAMAARKSALSIG